MVDPVATFDAVASLRAYRRELRARFNACPGGNVTQYSGRCAYYCDGCGSEFANETQAREPKHLTKEEKEEARNVL